ncbi:MAG: hypothetical protein AAF481_16210 [Acidobacteriota bacterium]
MDASGKTPAKNHSAKDHGGESATPEASEEPLYFFPDREVMEEELRAILEEGPEDQRAWAISHLLRYAQWDDIWTYVTRDEVREIFATLDLPESLSQAWGRMLKIEAPVG